MQPGAIILLRVKSPLPGEAMIRYLWPALVFAIAIGCSKSKPAKSETNEPSWTPAPMPPPPPDFVSGKRLGVGPGSWPGYGQKQYTGPVPQGTEAATRPAQMPAGMLEEIEQTFKPLQARGVFHVGQRLLAIEFTRTRIPEGTLRQLERYSQYITSLSFVLCEISDSELQTLPELPWLFSLEMKNCRGYTDRGMQKLAPKKRLTSLLMEGAPIGDGALAVIGQLESLKTLDLSRTLVTDAGLKYLASLSNLTGLILNRTRITGSGLKHLASLSKLTTLYLAESAVTDEGLAQIANIPGLVWIILDRTAVGDAGLKAVIENIPSITTFNLQGTRVTDAGVKWLANVPACSRVDLSKSRVTMMGINEIKAKFPKAVVIGP